MARIVVEKGRDKGRIVPIPAKGYITVGRDAACNLPLDDTMVSRTHFRIEQKEDAFLVVDLESFNGTIVNGEPCKTAKARPGDVIKVGMTVLSIAADESRPDPWVGRRVLGKYQILERIGRGGMGTCYKAMQTDLDRIVALKAISPEYSGRKDFVDLFIHEARFAAKLNHPNVVQIYEVGQEGGLYFYAMEFVAGGTVADRLTAIPEHRLSPREAIDITLQTARALEYAHAKGIMHRDIKPENMLLGESGQMKLTDLGLAQSLGEKVVVSDRSYVLGTPHFIAPEIIRNKPFDFRSDIYSLGVSLYQMLTGRLPFDADDMKELVRLKLNTEPPPIETHVPGVPRLLAMITMKMLRRDPEERYATITDAIVELEQARAQLTGGRRLPMKLVVPAAAGVALLAGLLIFALARSTGTPPPPPPPPERADDSAALTMFLNADTFELKFMDKRKVESIQEGIQRYDEIVKRFPQSDSARKSRERKSALEKRIVDLRSEQELAATQANEDTVHRAFQASLGLRKPDPTVFSEVTEAYKAIVEKFPGTRAAGIAVEKAATIEKWLSGILEMRGWFESTQDKVENHLATLKFEEALKSWDEFVVRAEEKRAQLTGARDPRYRDVYYDREGKKERDRVVATIQSLAQARLARVDEQIQKQLFDRADEDLDEAEKELGVLSSIRKQIAEKRREVERGRSQLAAAARKEEEERHKQDLAADAQQFQNLCREVYESYSSKYLFAQAKSSVVDRRRDLIKTPEYRAKLEAREKQLQRAELFLRSFINVVNDTQNQYNIKRAIDYPALGLKGKLAEAGPETLGIEIGTGVIKPIRLEQIRPHQFHAIVRGAWKITDFPTMINFISFLMECGGLDGVRTELKDMAALPKFAESREAVEFHAQALKAIDLESPVEDPEVEAQKRLAALTALNEAGELEAALDLLLQLEQRLADTHYYKANRDAAQKQLQDIKRKLREPKKKP